VSNKTTHHPELSRYEVLIDVARRLSSFQDLEQLLDVILNRSREVMNCQVCSIFLPDSRDEGLVIRSTLDAANVIHVPKGKGIASVVFETRKTLNIRDASKDPRYFKAAADMGGIVSSAMLTVPLLDGDRCLGVMQAINPHGREVFGRGDEELFESFASLVSVTLLRIESHKKEIHNAENRQQMELAREIQSSFLPPNTLCVGSIMLESFYQPAAEIGGDFFFWHEIGDGKLLLGIGDVCGKGLAAALDMARGTTLIASMAFQCRRLGLAHWVNALNGRLCEVMRAGRFIALSAMLIDSKRRHAYLCCAGLPPPKVLDHRTGWRDVSVPGNPPLGIASHLRYDERQFPLGLGRQWLLLSDGILELQNDRSQYFEDSAFPATLQRAFQSGAPLLHELAADWRAFADGAMYQDDATALTVTDHAPAPPPAVSLNCDADALKEVRDFVDAWAAHAGFDNDAAGLLVLGCDEVFSNVCKHAYCPASGGGPATCQVNVDEESLHIIVEHHGAGIDDDDFERLIQPPSQGERIGGLGCHVIRQIFDLVHFHTEPGLSRIQLSKRLPQEPFAPQPAPVAES